MILEIDMGNSRIKWRLRSQSARLAGGVLEGSYLALGDLPALDEPLEQVWVASVLAPELNQKFSSWCEKHLGVRPRFARSQRFCAGLINGYQDFERLGVDRWLAMVAAFSVRGGPALVVQAGSAITVDLIAASGQHLGGYIGPGLGMMRRSLGSETDGVDPGAAPWGSLSLDPGTDTQGAVQAALGAMALGIIERGLGVLEEQESSFAEPMIYLAGGDGPLLYEHLPRAFLASELVLDGLAPVLSSLGTSGKEI